ncbi:(4Fe-4S)-binding protein [Methylomicrobium sp. Wu6]|uniref:(4Fe-4S)-binding protein n=1 Tax=Methylomicrobium sp. Wu6 TaxID=3107928 RepID=UPI002DD61A5C|nr:(4Fe-4S)-binding protein [Methylomicrobium sp. Wu6]MEC4747560.1 (4Fe-4S)-binding protein [Methylomicrobium sp. Wu6]
MQVTWNQNKCCHTGVCVSSLPEVFKVEDDQFVIDTGKASEEEIKNVVYQCPAGALQVVNDKNKREA